MTADGPQSHLDLDLEEGTRLNQVVEKLGYVDQIEHMILAINGVVADPEDILQDGDTLRIMPAISGGTALFKETEFLKETRFLKKRSPDPIDIARVRTCCLHLGRKQRR
jgi:sulfur carrier protein ThiS